MANQHNKRFNEGYFFGAIEFTRPLTIIAMAIREQGASGKRSRRRVTYPEGRG
jgi:hypothetical protein